MAALTFGSVCSGIEAASVAWHRLGWKAAWLAEIEPFPSAVLTHHYPDVPNLGDMTGIAAQVADGRVCAPDVLVGGTPCQAFSIAGLRQSLDDDRGQLTLEYVRLANAIDAARVVAGQQPAVCVWENVPGVLTTKDNAFGCFLAALVGESDPLQPSGSKWTNAGCVFGPQRAVAWRIIDAQFFGVAQRRRRVFVVASARKGFDPSQVLFEFDGLRRDIAPCRKTWKETAGHAGKSAQKPSYLTMSDPVLTLCASDSKGVSNQNFCDGKIIAQPVALNVSYAFDSLSSNSMKSANPHSGCRETDLSKTLDTSTPCPSKNQGGVCVVMAFPTELSGTQCASSENVSPCLSVSHGVSVCFQQNSRDEVRLIGGDGSIAGALMAEAGAKQQNYILSEPHYIVRRLMPVEHERLQGFPDGYTKTPYRKKTSDDCADSPRYKALGNSMAVPCMAWLGKRIDAALQVTE